MKRTKKFLATFISIMMLMSSVSVTSFAYTLTGGSTFPFVNYTMTDDFSEDATISSSAYQGWYYKDSSNNAASYAEIKDGMLHVHNDKADTSNNGFLYWKMGKNYTGDNKDYALDKGLVEFGFEFKFEGNIFSVANASSGRFLQYGNQRILAIVGSNLYTGYPGTNNPTLLTDSLTSGEWYSFKIGMNMAEGKTEYFYFNNQLIENVNLCDFKIYSSPTAATYFEVRPQFSGNNTDHADLYIDNVFLKQYTAEFISANINDGDKAVNTAAPIVLEFGDTLTEDSAANITITKNGGTVSGITPTVNGKKVIITHPEFDEASEYTINIPATIVSEKNLKISAAKTISFTTGRKTTLYSTDFDNFASTERASVGAAMTAAKIKSGGMGWQYVVNGDYAIANVTAETPAGAHWDKNSQYGLVLDGTNNYVLVENGRLSMKSGTYRPSSVANYDNRFLRLLPPTALTSGVVKLGFDYESTITTSLGTSGYVQNMIKIGSLAQIGYHNKKLAYWDYVNGSWNTIYLNVNGVDTLLENVNHRFDFVLDLDNNVATVTVDGVAHTNLPLNPNGKLNEVQINTKTLTNNSGTAFTNHIKMDNVSLEIFDTPAVINKEITCASLTDGITLEFNTLMSNVTGVTMTNANGVNVGYTGTLASNGYQYTVDPSIDLEPSAIYTITVPAQVNAEGIVIAQQVISVTTLVNDNKLYLADYDITGDLTPGASFSVTAYFGNGSEKTQNPWLGVALYDSDNKLVEVAADSSSLVSSELKKLTAGFTVPTDIKAGAYIKIFAWNNITELEPLAPAILFPEAE